jgi:hypothetical protein
MSRTLSISKTGLIVFLASTFFVVGCGDKRGFDTKRIKSPIAFGKDQPAPPQQQDPDDQLSGGQDSAVLTPEKMMKAEETEETLHQVLENTTISYVEGGQEVPITQEMKQELLKELTDLAAKTNSLPREQQFVRGLSLTMIQPAENQKGIEVRAHLQLNERTEDMVSQVMLQKVKSELDPKATLSGATKDANWVNGSTDLQSETWALCAGVEADPCPAVTVALKVALGENVQVSVVKFVRDESGYVLDRTSSGNIVSFEDARNGEVQDQNEEGQQDQQEAQEQQADESGANVQQQEGAAKDQQNTMTFRQAEQESMAKYEQYKKEQEAAKAKAVKQDQTQTKSTQTFRQAEQESMAKYEQYKKEREAAKAKAQTTSTQTFRQAEIASMDALRKMEREQNVKTFRQAEQESMAKYEQYKKEQEAAKAKTQAKATQTFRQAEQASMDALRKMEHDKNVKTFRQAEQESMAKYEQYKKEQEAKKKAAQASTAQ